MIFPVRQRQVQALDDPMQIIGGVMRQAVDADMLHQRQRLLQRRPLAPRAAGDQLMPAPGRGAPPARSRSGIPPGPAIDR